MSTIRLASRPADFDRGFVRLLPSTAPCAHELIEAAKVPEIEAAVLRFRDTLAGTSSVISVHVLAGRKPYGFDKWRDSVRVRELCEIRGSAPPTRSIQ